MSLYLVLCVWLLLVVINTGASDWLERLVPEMIYYASRGTLNSTYSLILFPAADNVQCQHYGIKFCCKNSRLVWQLSSFARVLPNSRRGNFVTHFNQIKCFFNEQLQKH